MAQLHPPPLEKIGPYAYGPDGCEMRLAEWIEMLQTLDGYLYVDVGTIGTPRVNHP